jgi:predicted metal-dependent phosphoesterase TrpH
LSESTPNFTLRPDDAIDLHLHTLYSDGHWRPVDLFDHLAARGFRAAAVTDHDTLRHVDEMRLLGMERGIAVLAGVEVTTSWRGITAHLLCYAAHFTGSALDALCQQTEQAQLDNTRAVHAELLRRGYTFPRKSEPLAEHDGQPVRPVDNATLLHAHGYASGLDAALAMIADAGYRQISAPLADALAAAHADGAVALLAHPGRGGGEIHRFDPNLLGALLDDLPLDGVEVHYPTHTSEQTAAYVALVGHRGLLSGAGSDSHGPRQRLPIAYPAHLAAALLAHCGITVVPHL